MMPPAIPDFRLKMKNGTESRALVERRKETQQNLTPL